MTHAPADPATEAEIAALLESPETSRWLKVALRGALERDCVDAANDAEVLLKVLCQRAEYFLPPTQPSPASVAEELLNKDPKNLTLSELCTALGTLEGRLGAFEMYPHMKGLDGGLPMTRLRERRDLFAAEYDRRHLPT